MNLHVKTNRQSRHCALSVREWELSLNERTIRKERVFQKERAFFRKAIILRYNAASAAALKGKPHFLFSVVCICRAKKKGGVFVARTRKIVYISLLTALSIVLTRILSFYPIPTIRISFGDIPIMISGLMLGPLPGAVTGMLSDFIGMLIFSAPTGVPYFPGFTLSKILVGIIPALTAMVIRKQGWYRIAAAVILTEIVCSLLLDSLWLSMIYNKGILLLLPARILTRAIIAALEIPIIYVLMEALKKAAFSEKI